MKLLGTNTDLQGKVTLHMETGGGNIISLTSSDRGAAVTALRSLVAERMEEYRKAHVRLEELEAEVASYQKGIGLLIG